MASSATIRLEKELANLRKHPVNGCSAQPKDGNLFEWTGMIQDPQETPYADGTLKLEIHFPQRYPYEPPTLTFATKIYHPNIDSDNGFVGLDDIHPDEWSPALTISHVLMSLAAFLRMPNPSNAVVPKIAHEYETNIPLYRETAMEWSERYAK